MVSINGRNLQKCFAPESIERLLGAGGRLLGKTTQRLQAPAHVGKLTLNRDPELFTWREKINETIA